jgi:hypothetical protein
MPRCTAKVVRTAVKANAQKVRRFGLLAKSIGQKVKTYPEAVAAIVGPRSKKIWEKGVRVRGKHKGEAVKIRPSYYAHLVERGGARIKAKPFEQPALDDTAQQFFDVLSNAIERRLARELSK